MKTADLSVVTLSGDAHQRGRIHGEALREQINTLAGIWKESIAVTHGRDPDEYLREFLSTTAFLEAAQTWTPHLVFETEGIAEGAKLDWTTAFSLQLMDEEWWYGREKLAQSKLQAGLGCSTIGVAEGDEGTTLIGQTMDIELWKEGFQALLKLEKANDRPDALIYTTAGSVGLMGVNRPGIGVCVNALMQLQHRNDGVPVACIVRALLSRQDHDEAVDFLRRVPHASGQHYLVASRGRLSSLECSANEVKELDAAGLVLHTNHPFENADFSKDKAASRTGQRNSERRLKAIKRHAELRDRAPSVDDLKSAFASRDDAKHPVSRGAEDVRADSTGYTIGAAVFDLKTPPIAHIAAGPPNSTEFMAFTF